MAIKVGGTEVISDSRALNNIASVDAATVTALSDAGVGGGGLQSVQVFTSSGTWTKPSGIAKIVVRLVGGGGGGGGSGFVGSGAGSGGYSQKFIDVSAVSSVAVTIGAAGSGGVAGSGGTSGGTTSFGAYCSATGGGGGSGGNNGGTGGTGTGGDINITGQYGGATILGSVTGQYGGGAGGDSMLGHGGAISRLGSTTHPVGRGYGAGGAGAADASTPYVSGGNGAPGIVIVEEYA